uniref:Putative ovule protein n=2 Tax=Solanum TaxID=4107 RepID=A0A0V0GVT6_SOLCH
MLVRSHDRTSQAPRNVHNVEVVFPMRSITPASRMAYIDNMSLVQLKALANQLNIVGVSKTRKADLQQLLRSKLQAQDWS